MARELCSGPGPGGSALGPGGSAPDQQASMFLREEGRDSNTENDGAQHFTTCNVTSLIEEVVTQEKARPRLSLARSDSDQEANISLHHLHHYQ